MSRDLFSCSLETIYELWSWRQSLTRQETAFRGRHSAGEAYGRVAPKVDVEFSYTSMNASCGLAVG